MAQMRFRSSSPAVQTNETQQGKAVPPNRQIPVPEFLIQPIPSGMLINHMSISGEHLCHSKNLFVPDLFLQLPLVVSAQQIGAWGL